jgi:hypothetical protein
MTSPSRSIEDCGWLGLTRLNVDSAPVLASSTRPRVVYGFASASASVAHPGTPALRKCPRTTLQTRFAVPKPRSRSGCSPQSMATSGPEPSLSATSAATCLTSQTPCSNCTVAAVSSTCRGSWSSSREPHDTWTNQPTGLVGPCQSLQISLADAAIGHLRVIAKAIGEST